MQEEITHTVVMKTKRRNVSEELNASSLSPVVHSHDVSTHPHPPPPSPQSQGRAQHKGPLVCEWQRCVALSTYT
ncbi:hypothetical protein E2C01_032310 [Portunus trituberculatus]|uniref:Uncharacterized protein n=1 Tax=Portunus trituberculatus TaxID=210409 RepID=A0A5B7F2G1_PORTR|nr:hypothetical protein [Portunus trituberculatus]